jgi:peptidoglycan hydrolase-like protein with peptidoglycan-binding domain
MRKTILCFLALIGALGIIAATPALAQTSPTTNLAAIQVIIQQLQARLNSLQEKIRMMATVLPAQPATPAQPSPGTGTPAIPATPATPALPATKSQNFDIYYNPYCAVSENYYNCPPEAGPPFTIIRTNLRRGSSGYEVRQLQGFLKQSPSVYPEGYVTGYYGSLTEDAVKRFQEGNNIEPVGVVGPKTRAKLNELVTDIATATSTPPSSQ